MSLNSKQGSKSNRKSLSTTTTPTKSAVKELPGKLAKEVKHQFRRLDGVLHHVIHPHRHGVRTHPFSVTSPSSPIFYPIDIVRAFLPPDQSSATGSVHSRDTWDVKYANEIDSIDETPTDLSIDLSMSVGNSSTTHIDTLDELHLPQEEPQLNLHEQDTSASDPIVTSPTVPLVDDKEEDSHSKGEADANTQQPVSLDLPSTPYVTIPQTQASSDANPEQVVLPSQPVSLDLPSTSDASIPQTQATSDAQQVLPSHAVPVDTPSTSDVSIPQTQASSDAQQVLPSHAVPVDTPSIPDAIIPQPHASSDANPQELVLPSQAVPLDIPSIPDPSIPQPQPANPQEVVLPSRTVLLDIPSVPDASIPQPQASSDANDADSQEVVSQAVPLDLPSSPEASIPQALPPLQGNIAPPAGEEEDVPDLDVPALAVPSMFLPILNVRRSFSSNLLTWWLPFSPLPLPSITPYFASILRIVTSKRWLVLLVVVLLIRDSTARY